MKGLQRSIALIMAMCACDKSVTHSSISGTIHLASPRAPIALPDGVRKVCGEQIHEPFRPAVVWVKDAKATEAGANAPLLDQKRCSYQPPVLVGHTGGKLKVKNSDPLMHNVRAGDLFNVGMPIENQVIERPLPNEPGPVKIVCDVHPWMRADLMVLPHDQWAVTDAEGRFKIDGVGPGAHTLHVWHPTLGEKDVPVGSEGKVDTSLP
jgi:hypothetical protein